MSTTVLAIIGFIAIASLMFLLLSGKTTPIVTFILVPIIAAFIAGYGVNEINEFVKGGLNSVLVTAVMFMFSITYFNIMNDAGLFDPIVRAIIPKGRVNIFIILMAALLTTYVGHLDGSGATTWMIVLSAFLPIVDKVGIRRTSLLCVAATGMTAANLVPWGGPTVRAATVLAIDANQMFTYIIPSLVIMVILSVAIVWLLARAEMKLLGTNNTEVAISEETEGDSLGEGRRAKTFITFKDPKWIVNFILTVLILVLLFSGILSSYVCFMIGVAIALMINYPNMREQQKRLKNYAGQAMIMAMTLFCVGVFLGIMRDGGFIEAIATVIVNVIPNALASHAHWIIAWFSVPLMMALGTDSFYYVMLPIIIGVVEPLGVDPISVTAAYLITGTFGSSIAPGTAAMYVGLGLADVDVGTHIKFSIRYLWPFSIICLIISTIIGIVQF